MKQTLIILAVLILTSIATSGQANNTVNTKIPEFITMAFSEQYPNTHVFEWEKSKDSFIAKFIANRKSHKATFGIKGDWIQTEIDIKLKELPMRIVNAYFSNKSVWENWTSAKEILCPDYTITYVIIGDNEEEESDPFYEFKLYFTSNGELIKRELNE